MSKTPVYVIGHKNPDADSVCAAIAYAAFQKARGADEYIPARAGNSNARIDALMGRFNTALPVLINDVTPRVRDVMATTPHTLLQGATCAEALELIDRHDIRALPVLDKDGRVKGVLSIFHLGEFFAPKPRDPRQMRRVHTSVNAVLGALKAQALHLHQPERKEDIFLRVGAMDVKSFGRFSATDGIAPEQSCVIVGDRRDIQLCAIEMGVRALVITGNLTPEPDVLALAKEKNVCLIKSPLDTATTAWTIRIATFADPLMETPTERWREDEKLSVLRRRLGQSAADSPLMCVTDNDEKLLGVFSRSDLLKPPRTKLALVDHNELSQAVAGANEVQIVAVIDHHRLGSLPTAQPILFHNEPVGSTCTIIGGFFRECGLAPDKDIAGLMMGGIISDTMNLRSPTTTPKDADILQWLSQSAKLDIAELAHLIFDSGSLISKVPAAELIVADAKQYTEGKARFSVAQVEELGFERFREHAEEIMQALEGYRKNERLLFSGLLVTDINTQNSLLVMAGDSSLKNAIAYAPTPLKGVFDLPGIVSRKKQLIPYLTSLIHTLGLA